MDPRRRELRSRSRRSRIATHPRRHTGSPPARRHPRSVRASSRRPRRTRRSSRRAFRPRSREPRNDAWGLLHPPSTTDFTWGVAARQLDGPAVLDGRTAAVHRHTNRRAADPNGERRQSVLTVTYGSLRSPPCRARPGRGRLLRRWFVQPADSRPMRRLPAESDPRPLRGRGRKRRRVHRLHEPSRHALRPAGVAASRCPERDRVDHCGARPLDDVRAEAEPGRSAGRHPGPGTARRCGRCRE